MATRRLSVLFALLPALPALAAGCSGSSSPSASAGPVVPELEAGAPTPDASAPPPSAPLGVCPSGVPFTTIAGKIVVPVSLNGGPTKRWILDTGAPGSYIDTSIAAQYPGLVKVAVAGIERTVALQPEPLQLTGAGIYGIVGQNVFAAALTIDYPRKRVWIADTLNEADLLACDHVKRTPTTVDVQIGNYIYTKGTIEGTAGSFLVDSGASYGATNKAIFAALDNAHPRPSIGGWYTPAAAGTFWARASTIGYLEVGGLRVDHVFTRTIDDAILPPPVKFGSDPFLGVLPSGFLHHFMVTIDLKQKTMRLDAGKDDSLVEPTIMYVVGIGLEETMSGPVHVTDVLPRSAADKAGIMVGDELVKINGSDAGTIDAASRAYELAAPTAGTSITVTTAHGSDPPIDHVLVTQDVLTSPMGLK